MSTNGPVAGSPAILYNLFAPPVNQSSPLLKTMSPKVKGISGGPQYAVGLYTPIVDENITGCSVDFQSRIGNITDNFTGGRLRIEFREVASPTTGVVVSDWLTPKTLLPVVNVRAASTVLGMAGRLLAGRQYFGLVVGDNATGVGFMTYAVTVRKSS